MNNTVKQQKSTMVVSQETDVWKYGVLQLHRDCEVSGKPME